jgi:Arm DNA-binding domain
MKQMRMKLTARFCANEEPSEDAKKSYSLKDGDLYQDALVPGLFFEVMASGHKAFGIQGRLNGKEIKFMLGVYPVLSLDAARERALVALRQMVDGLTRERRDAARGSRRPSGRPTASRRSPRTSSNATSAHSEAQSRPRPLSARN